MPRRKPYRCAQGILTLAPPRFFVHVIHVTLSRYSNNMPTYTKLFNSIVTSTIWTEDDKTRIVWITMLAMADQHGEVHASVPGLARVAGVGIEDCEKALSKLLSPDPYSRTPANEGRRISPIDGGWELLNHAKYRVMASKEDAKAATAARVKRFRERNANVTPCNAGVTEGNARVTQGRDIAEAEAEAEEKADYVEESKDSSPAPTPAIAWSAAGGWEGISEKDFDSYRIAYPACDLTRQLEAMHQWLLANPAKAKKKQWRRFISNWLNRAQERGGDIASNPAIASVASQKPQRAQFEPKVEWIETWRSIMPEDETVKFDGSPITPVWSRVPYPIREQIMDQLGL